jgi:hypothetical protein
MARPTTRHTDRPRSTGDDLTVRLFVAGTAIAVGLAAAGSWLAVSAAGAVAVILTVLFALASFLLALWSFRWHWVKQRWPRLTNAAASAMPRVGAFATPIMLVLVLAFIGDVISRAHEDRTQSQISTLYDRLAVAEMNRQHLQSEADYRRVLLYGTNGQWGLQQELNSLLNGGQMRVPQGYALSGQFVRLTQAPQMYITMDPNQRSGGPCFKIRNSGTIKGKNWNCENHSTGLDADKVKSIDIQGQTTK